MTSEIQDFETENLLARHKFRLTSRTLQDYCSFSELLNAQKSCLQDKCLRNAKTYSIDEFQKCITNCETGQREILKMQVKHAEVTRLTYSKNIQRCLSIHGDPMSNKYFADIEDNDAGVGSSSVNSVALAHCIQHNTDKVDRRYFGYYGGQRADLVNKYAYP